MAAEKKAYPLRISAAVLEAMQRWADDDLRSVNAELEAWAADELRSVNGQIEYVLKQAVAKRKGTSENPSSSLQGPPAATDAARP